MTYRNENQILQKASFIAGLGLFFMAILAGYGNFGVLERLVIDDKAVETSQNIAKSMYAFKAGIVSLSLVAILDVIVAIALYKVFVPVNAAVSRLAAGVRIIYAVVFAVAISMLAKVVIVVGEGSGNHAVVMDKITSFNDIWQAGLLLFGIHLFLIGYLTFRARYMPKYLGILLIIAGCGYLIDSIGSLFANGYLFNIAGITFIGEVALMFWLLIKGRKMQV